LPTGAGFPHDTDATPKIAHRLTPESNNMVLSIFFMLNFNRKSDIAISQDKYSTNIVKYFHRLGDPALDSDILAAGRASSAQLEQKTGTFGFPFFLCIFETIKNIRICLMKTKILLSTLFMVFSVGAISGQGLTIKGNSRYYTGGERITRAEALTLAAPYPDVAAQIQKGVKLKRVAMGVGFAGLGVALAGAGLFLGEIGGPDPMFGGTGAMSGKYETGIVIGIVAMSVGGAMGLSSIGIGIAGVGAQKKAMQLYNTQTDYAALPWREAMYLSLSPTIGGLGLQLTF
jgi:hypothetical protein